MPRRQSAVWWLATALAFIAGALLVWRGDHNGWFLIVLGTVYLGGMTDTARRLAASKPRFARWGLVGITLLLLVLVLVVGLVRQM